ncbi:exosortase family protein XrtG [Loigolactobacillus coryniformis]|uniref:exosortase family protein XrtG n=1 Tax=Loigolactobacillus coryniformis TaxID=1610 RepID=UPI0023421455|nr:exosortase family protein XrtG [Loigolactobacillus coryniformis]MDC4186096.1 exosortase family protein XrtG [Loigolactobacillus coryniformis]
MNIYLLIGIVVWLYLLSILKRARLSAFHFIIGSGGLFFILIALSDPYWVWFFTHAVINGVKWFGELTGMSTVMNRYGLISISNPTAPVTMSIDYECSGIIETVAFLSMVIFLPMYNKFERVFFSILGTLWIYVANVIRLVSVIMIVHFGGGNLFFLAHSIVDRLIFYVLVIMLYYEVFTFSQLSQGLYHIFKIRVQRFEQRIRSMRG